MYTVYSNWGQGWVYMGDYNNKIDAEYAVFVNKQMGYKVELVTPDTPIELDPYD